MNEEKLRTFLEMQREYWAAQEQAGETDGNASALVYAMAMLLSAEAGKVTLAPKRKYRKQAAALFGACG